MTLISKKAYNKRKEEVIFMIDINMIIAKNVSHALKNAGKKQYELADALGCSRQIVSNMLSGSRNINALELKKIADFCNVSMEKLITLPEQIPETNLVRAFMGQVQTDEARKGIEIADKLIDLYLFHSRIDKKATVGSSERSSL